MKQHETIKNAFQVPVFDEFLSIINSTTSVPLTLTPVDRNEFYRRSASAYAVVATGETALYGNIIITKGIVTDPVIV